MQGDETVVRQGQGRGVLLAIAAVFFGAAFLAGVLRFSGWQPAISRNHGELLNPARDVRQTPPLHLNGQSFAWEPARRQWRIVVPAEPDCGDECVDLSQNLSKVWQLLGHNADNVQILWLGSVPDGTAPVAARTEMAPSPALRAALPGLPDVTGIPVYVVDPNGFVILRYAPGFDPAGLRSDLAKLLKLK